LEGGSRGRLGLSRHSFGRPEEQVRHFRIASNPGSIPTEYPKCIVPHGSVFSTSSDSPIMSHGNTYCTACVHVGTQPLDHVVPLPSEPMLLCDATSYVLLCLGFLPFRHCLQTKARNKGISYNVDTDSMETSCRSELVLVMWKKLCAKF